MKKRSFVALLLSIVMAVVAMFALAGCGDEPEKHAPDKSFSGSMSAQSYATENEAAQAFLSLEIDGATTQTTFVSYDKEADLVAEEIAKLTLGEDFADVDITAESGTISYTDGGYEQTARVILIKSGAECYYYVPTFEKGERVTDSYMNTVLDYTKYTNFTETVKASVSANAGGQTATVTTTTTTKVTENAIHYKQSIPALSQTTEFYFVSREYGLEAYMKDGNDWESMGIVYESVDAFLETAFKIDHSYFIKTETGFKLNPSKTNAYLDDVLGDLVEKYLKNGVNVKITSISGDYYVKDARLDSISAKVRMNVTIQGQSGKVNVTSNTSYSKFGTTKVNLPASIEA